MIEKEKDEHAKLSENWFFDGNANLKTITKTNYTMNQDDYKKKYNEALERAKQCYEGNSIYVLPKKDLEYIFPELAESEDEKTRKEIIDFVVGNTFFKDGRREKYLAWIEKQGKQPYWKPSEEQLQTLHAQLNEGAVTYPEDKRILFTLYEDLMKIMTQEENQGEQKSADEVEPKFKVGDWVVTIDDEGDVATEMITKFWGNKVELIDTEGIRVTFPQYELNHYHLWTIQDAKDGDVLVASDDSIFIFKEIKDCGCKH